MTKSKCDTKGTSYFLNTMTSSYSSSSEDALAGFTINIAGTILEVQRASTDVSADQGQLLKTKDGKLFIDKDGSSANIIAITDSAGGTPTFDYSSSWSDGIYSSSSSQKSIAVEQQSNGSFKLAVKNTNTYDNTTNVDWNVYNISSTGVLDWSNSTRGGITKHENDFNQDLNGDGGNDLAAVLKAVATDVTGARLKRDADNGLYIDDAGNIIAIEDNYGGTPTFDNSSSWSDSYSSGSCGHPNRLL